MSAHCAVTWQRSRWGPVRPDAPGLERLDPSSASALGSSKFISLVRERGILNVVRVAPEQPIALIAKDGVGVDAVTGHDVVGGAARSAS